MIQINDTFRVRRYKNRWREELWQLEEWIPTTEGPHGRWKAISGKMNHDTMTKLLERRQCPGEALAEFKEAATE